MLPELTLLASPVLSINLLHAEQNHLFSSVILLEERNLSKDKKLDYIIPQCCSSHMSHIIEVLTDEARSLLAIVE